MLNKQKTSPSLEPTEPTVPAPPKEPVKKTGNISSAGIVVMVLFILIVAGVGGYFVYQKFFPNFLDNLLKTNTNQAVLNQNQPIEPDTDSGLLDEMRKRIAKVIGAPIASAHDFAAYNEPAVTVAPAIPDYQANADLSNVTNQADFTFSQDAKNFLAKNNFVVIPSYSYEFFSIYENNRYNYTPSFITTDSMFHNYHLAFDFLLRTIEANKFKPMLTELTYGMVLASQAQYEELKGTEWENAAKRNVAFFTVANKLVYPEAEPADYVAEEVAQEIELIEKHDDIHLSAVMNMGLDISGAPLPQATEKNLEMFKEDYTQYIPRGHYTRTEDLKVYFKSMMYLGRMTFRLKNEDETRSAILTTQALQALEDMRNLWEAIYEPTVFFVGKADDLSFFDYQRAIVPEYGDSYELRDLLDNDKFDSSLAALKNLPSPKINSMPIFDARFQPDRDKEIKGFRFMGQRYTLDADIFQRLVYREVGDKEHDCDSDPLTWFPQLSRRLPSGLDIAAAFGSAEAYNIQDQKGEDDYACYSENLNMMKEHVAGLEGKTWVQNLYWGWLHSLRPLLAEKIAGYPSFMQNTAWRHKDLNAFLGSWTELKHDTILYAKQVYAECGAGPSPDIKDDRGYVEPNPHVYARLAALTKMTKEGLEMRSLLSESNIEFLERLEEMALTLKEISEKELANQALSDDDYDFIRTYGGSLEHMWIEAYSDLGVINRSQLSDEPAALIADVATDPSGMVLEEGIGRIFEVFAIVPVDGELRIAKGGVFSHYEFSWPMSDRLTDEKWREMLKNQEEPDLAEWTALFIVD